MYGGWIAKSSAEHILMCRIFKTPPVTTLRTNEFPSVFVDKVSRKQQAVGFGKTGWSALCHFPQCLAPIMALKSFPEANNRDMTRIISRSGNTIAYGTQARIVTWRYKSEKRPGKWWAMRDSNSRHLRCKRSALPTELIALYEVRRLLGCPLALGKNKIKQIRLIPTCCG